MKRETENGKPDGIVSNFLHDEIHVGNLLDITAPAGDFILNMGQSDPVVLISGGVGLTPMISMLNTLVEKQPECKVTFIHAAINRNLHAMHEHLLECSKQHEQVDYYVCYEKPTVEDRVEKRFHKEGLAPDSQKFAHVKFEPYP